MTGVEEKKQKLVTLKITRNDLEGLRSRIVKMTVTMCRSSVQNLMCLSLLVLKLFRKNSVTE